MHQLRTTFSTNTAHNILNEISKKGTLVVAAEQQPNSSYTQDRYYLGNCVCVYVIMCMRFSSLNSPHVSTRFSLLWIFLLPSSAPVYMCRSMPHTHTHNPGETNGHILTQKTHTLLKILRYSRLLRDSHACMNKAGGTAIHSPTTASHRTQKQFLTHGISFWQGK